MQVKRTTYKRTTPKSQTAFSSWEFSMSGDLVRLLTAVAKAIAQYFGLLYTHGSRTRRYRGERWPLRLTLLTY